MKIDLVRHGETAAGAALNGRRSDVPATEAGDAAVRRQLQLVDPTHIVTSPMKRCRHVANSYGCEIGVPVQVCHNLAEYDFGEWDGRFLADLRRYYPKDVVAWYEDPERYQPPGAEHWPDFRNRVTDALRGLDRKYGPMGENVRLVVVTHAGVMRSILSFALGFSPRQNWAIRMEPATLMTLEYGFDQHGHLWGSLDRLLPP